MGTRHLQKVITKQGEVKLAQYGQWDGYPDGQGIDILDYLIKANLKKYQTNLDKIREVTQDDLDNEVNKSKNWKEDYPYLSRDCGSNIHQMIENGSVKFVNFIDDEEADKWCDGFYTIDFSKNTFTSEYHGVVVEFPLDNLPTKDEYLAKFQDNE